MLTRFVPSTKEQLPVIGLGTFRAFDARLGGAAGFHDEAPRVIEAFVLDFDGNLYGKHARLEFVKRLRGQERFDGVDALVAPTLGTVAYPNDRSFEDYRRGHHASRIGGAANAAGIPGITVPNGFGEDDLPTGLQLVGRAWSETTLLAIAAKYQDETDWHKKHPDV